MRTLVCLVIASVLVASRDQAQSLQRFLYVALPGVADEVNHGGVGVLVFDVDNGYRVVKRIATWHPAAGDGDEPIKGIAANARTGRLYVSTTQRLAAFDLLTDNIVWQRTNLTGCCDRLALSPDGRTLYVPSLHAPPWHVINSANGVLLAMVSKDGLSHDTIYGPDGQHVYLESLGSRYRWPTRRPIRS